MGWAIFFLLLVGGIVAYIVWRYKSRGTAPLEQAIIPAPNIFKQGENSVALCAEEVFIKAYNCARLKSVILRKIKADGILTITSKRVIFHTIGIEDRKGNINNDDFIHTEIPIADVTGISVSTGLASERALNILSPLFALLPGGKLKRLFFLDIHAKGVSGEDGVISVAPTDAKGMTVALPNYDMLPTSIVIEMAKEIGTLVSDVQMGVLDLEKFRN